MQRNYPIKCACKTDILCLAGILCFVLYRSM